MDLLDQSSALAIALAMRKVDADKLGAAAAVPLVIAMLHCEVECKNKVGARQAVMSDGQNPSLWDGCRFP